MRLLRICVIILFVVISVVFGGMYVENVVLADKTVPVINIDTDLLEVSLTAGDEELLAGVTAYDEKDKDITDRVIVESVSNFIDDGVCKVTYAVCDEDNHVAKKSRKIKYKDYESPKFGLAESTCYSIYDRINLAKAVTATDCIDGDISKQVIITSENYTKSVAGVFSVNVTVSNKKGDVSELEIPLIVEERELSAPVIELKDYLLYVKKDSKLNLPGMIVSAEDSKGNDLRKSVKIESDIDTSKEGTYTVHYYATDEDNLRGHTILTVVVGN